MRRWGILISLLLTTLYIIAQDSIPQITVDTIEPEKKEKFIDYFNLMPKAVRDYTPKDFFDPFQNLEINSIEIYIVNRFDDPVYAEFNVNEIDLVENKRGKYSAILVRKQLLFKEGQQLDPQLFADTERNIRENTIFKDAVIRVTETPHIGGVDVKIYVHDNRHWKAVFWGSPTSLTLGGGFYDFFGVSQSIEIVGGGIINPNNPYNVGAFYSVNNLFKSQINLDLSYHKENQSTGYGINFEREFFAYNTKWAGKVDVENTFRKIEDNSISNNYNNKEISAEFWLARSFGLPKINLKKETIRFIISSRFQFSKHYRIPENQPFQNFVNKEIYLFSFGFATRDWYGFEELYGFRKFDYVPKGFNLAFIGGLENNQFLGNRFYNGVTTNYSKLHPKFGYLRNEISLGSFIRDKSFEQLSVQHIASYFTNKICIGRLGYRQFINTTTTLSFNRPESELYNIGNSAFRGFQSQSLIATKSFIINTEAVFYTNLDWWTSRGNFFFFADLGWLSTKYDDFIFDNTLYQAYGGGIRFQNLKTGINFMEVSIAYYPKGYLVNERNWGVIAGEIPPRKVPNKSLFEPKIIDDIY